MTERLYVQKPRDAEFSAKVVQVRDKQVRLDATLFYPSSGGQPHDTGELAETRVVDVREEGEEVWHVVEDARGHAAGASVRGKIDLARRRDHREQHTGQHLLSAVLIEMAKAPTVAFHLGAELSTIDVKADKLSREMLDRVEKRCSEAIRANTPVAATIFRGADAEREAKTLRNAPEPHAVASPRGLRVVAIEGIDRDACCGTHVERLGELGLVKVLASERGKKAETRLHFVVGGRALLAFQQRQAVLDELQTALTTGFSELPGRIAKIQADAKAVRLEARALREESLAARAESLAGTARPHPRGGSFVVVRIEGGESSDARVLATKLVAARKDLACAVVHVGEQLSVVVARGEAAVALDSGAALRAIVGPLGGKGGGQPALAQGAAPAPGKVAEALALAEAALGK